MIKPIYKSTFNRLVARRIVSSVVILLLLITFLFFLIRISPGDPTQKLLSPKLSAQLVEKVKDSFGLNKPLSEQYLLFLKNLFQGNLGISYSFREPVIKVIWEFLSFTLIFASISFVVELIASFILSYISLKRINGLRDKFISNFSLLMYSAPSFVVGVSLIYIFSYKLNIFPVSGLSNFDAAERGILFQAGDYIYHLVLPVITLSLSGIAVFYRYLRDNLEEIYNQSFIWNLRANGIDEKTILFKHVIPNAVGPLISVAGIELGILFSGALITEVIFGLPGMGRLTIDSIMSRDYPLIIGCSFFAGLLIIFTNFIADILKALIDKRTVKDILN